MIALTIREALECTDEQIEQCIYFYKDGTTLFYIGRSDTPYERLRQHIGEGVYSGRPDYVGRTILNNLPLSLEWQVQIGTVRELAPDYCTDERVDVSTADWVERLLIGAHGPCLNQTINPNKRRLPEKYIPKCIANDGVKISEEKEEQA